MMRVKLAAMEAHEKGHVARTGTLQHEEQAATARAEQYRFHAETMERQRVQDRASWHTAQQNLVATDTYLRSELAQSQQMARQSSTNSTPPQIVTEWTDSASHLSKVVCLWQITQKTKCRLWTMIYGYPKTKALTPPLSRRAR